MTDSEFLKAFRDGSIAPNDFSHIEHIRLGYIHMSSGAHNNPITAFKQDLLEFIDRAGAEGKYHETITVAYLIIIGCRLRPSQPGQDWNSFRIANPDLFSSDSLSEYYSRNRLFSDLARKSFVTPDIKSLPELR
jgi:hypothetical protein